MKDEYGNVWCPSKYQKTELEEEWQHPLSHVLGVVVLVVPAAGVVTLMVFDTAESEMVKVRTAIGDG